ncbi:MAG TPA: 2,3-bisphosphoglycerate-independent phosphoglycerate mutase [Thermodesulfobacteriota bacterium]|nr:2,3-bisphosphoglycerate-independent phosphoglycerate mutase [Thermodesulfobacteriota bacterium]
MMIPEEILRSLVIQTDSKLVMVVIDGLGGLPVRGKTELEAAKIPNLDRLVSVSSCGLIDPIADGITPGSGPSHLALFGYDPFQYEIGRGVMEALGIGLKVTKDDLTARGNFATIDEAGRIIDRRAGRIPTEKNEEICQFLQKKIKEVQGVQISVYPGIEHRFVIVFRGEGLRDDLTDADPQKDGLKAKGTECLSSEAQRTSAIVNEYIKKATEALTPFHPANTILLRGFSKVPDIPSMGERFKLRPAAIATYPMYRGLARLVGMEILDTGKTYKEEVETLKDNFDQHDFFYIHFKKTDSAGEDGNFKAKVKALEEIDRVIPLIFELNPDVLVVTGDHSTPALLKSHSWHPNPLLLYSEYIRPDRMLRFTERQCQKGQLGRFQAVNVIPLMLGNGLKLKKFGA